MSATPVASAAADARRAASAGRAALVELAVRAAAGNLTRVGAALGVSKQRAHALAARCGLLKLAAELRAAAGQPARGRPRVRAQ